MLSTEQYWHDSKGKIQFGFAVGPSAKVSVQEAAGALAPLTVGAMRPSDNAQAERPTVTASRSLRPKCIFNILPIPPKWSHLICHSITDGLVATVSAKMKRRMCTPSEKSLFFGSFFIGNEGETPGKPNSSLKVLIVGRLVPYEDSGVPISGHEMARDGSRTWSVSSRWIRCEPDRTFERSGHLDD